MNRKIGISNREKGSYSELLETAKKAENKQREKKIKDFNEKLNTIVKRSEKIGNANFNGDIKIQELKKLFEELEKVRMEMENANPDSTDEEVAHQVQGAKNIISYEIKNAYEEGEEKVTEYLRKITDDISELKNSEKDISEKKSGMQGISTLLEAMIKGYKDVILNSEELNKGLEDIRKEIKIEINKFQKEEDIMGEKK